MLNRFIQLTLGLTVAASAVSAQESLKNKNDMEILPEQGEFAVGFNAVPVLNYLGNTFNGNTNNTFIGQNKFVSNLGQNVLFGKYMLESNVALRGHLRVGVSNDTRFNYVFDDTNNSPDSLVMDKGVFNDQIYVIGGGYEFRRGKGRVQGIYGGDVFFMHGRSSASYEYGNVPGMINQAPTSTTAFFANGGGISSPQGIRTVSEKLGSTFGVGLRPFAGVEFFFAPKISLGAEFGWNIMYSTRGEGMAIQEYYLPAADGTGRPVTIESPIAGSRAWNIDTDNFNGALFLMFYF